MDYRKADGYFIQADQARLILEQIRIDLNRSLKSTIHQNASSNSGIEVMKTANLWDGNDRAIGWRFDFPRSGGVPPQGQVWTRKIVIVEISFHNSLKMPLAKYDDLIKALPT
jgi:hypothetical protein